MDLPSVPSWMGEDSTRRRSEWTRPRDGSTPKSSVSKSSKEDRHVREINKRLKAIYEDEDKEYGADADASTIVDRFTVATRLRKGRIEEVFREIIRARNVELCFVMDATGSMGSYIAGVRQSIFDIVKKLTDTSPHVAFSTGEAQAQEMKVGMVAYRDFGDSPQIELLRFTNSISDFTAFCQKLQATGGADGPEDVFGGLDAALKLNWSPNAGTKVLFHIADAPCHGRDFHSGMADNYPTGDPKGLKHTELFSRIRSQGIQYYFGKITSHTDIMIKKFEEAYGEPITDFDIQNVDKITDSVITAVSDSISSSISASKRAVGAARKERTYVLIKAEPSWESLPTLSGKFISYAYPDRIKDIEDDVALERKKPKTASVKVANNPFGKGAERVAFYGKDVSTYVEGKKGDIVKHKDELIVLKEYLHLGKGMNSSKRYELSNQMQTIASFLAEKYVEDIQRQTGLKKTVKFIKIRTLAIDNGSNPRFMSAERRFATGDQFIRFTNNAEYRIVEEKALALGVSMEFVQLVMAFSHWTYKATDRFLMVVDLEGVVGKLGKDGEIGVLLTDPAIHCKDITRYGPMNHGSKGMDNFFGHHKCNKFCEYLGLTKFVPKGPSSSMPI